MFQEIGQRHHFRAGVANAEIPGSKRVESGDEDEAKSRQPEVALFQWKLGPFAVLVCGGFVIREELNEPGLFGVGIDTRRIQTDGGELLHGS